MATRLFLRTLALRTLALWTLLALAPIGLAGPARGEPAAEPARDPRLVGTWATQVILSTPGGSLATQLWMELRADGTLVDLGSRSMGAFPDASLDTGVGPGGGTAAWRTHGDALLVSQGGSPWVVLARFELSGDRLLLSYYDGDRTLWHRQ